ncbi:MAG: polyphosphate kinase 2 family protein [Vicinamibacterales bacterium]
MASASKSKKSRHAVVDSPYLVPFKGKFRVPKAPTRPPRRSRDDEANEQALVSAIKTMRTLQAKLLASDRKSLLIVFQAMDAAGKDGTIKAVMSGINPAGCEVHSFKKPSEDELDHDFLWRVYNRVPERGRIGIFNRSHYEEVLVVKVHPEILDTQRLPFVPDASRLWAERYESIRDFEKHLARNGTTIVKFFLNVSKSEQKKRLLERIDDPDANWKFQASDIQERTNFPRYMSAYEDALNETSRPWAPWYAVPADDKKYMRRVVAEILVETLKAMDLHYPTPSQDALRAMTKARRVLRAGT